MTPKLLVRDVSEYTDLPDGLEKIEDVYIFDDDVRVHCASLTASIECSYLYTVLHFADTVDSDRCEEMYDEFGCNEHEAIEYFLPGSAGIVDLKDTSWDDDDDEWDDVVDYYNCNHAY